jgi:hypothetical protein
MTRILSLVVLFVAACPSVAADDAILVDLNKAKATHAKELARLHDKLLADIDTVIKAESDRGAGINYLLKELKGFAENGVTPILPKLLPPAQKYLEGKKAADAELESAYTKSEQPSPTQSLKRIARPATGEGCRAGNGDKRRNLLQPAAVSGPARTPAARCGPETGTAFPVRDWVSPAVPRASCSASPSFAIPP